MNQKQAASALGCSQATVSRIMSGDRKPSVHLMFAIQRVFRWGLSDQLVADRDGVYADQFRIRVEKRDARMVQ